MNKKEQKILHEKVAGAMHTLFFIMNAVGIDFKVHVRKLKYNPQIACTVVVGTKNFTERGDDINCFIDAAVKGMEYAAENYSKLEILNKIIKCLEKFYSE